jgi:hypothetical protein
MKFKLLGILALAGGSLFAQGYDRDLRNDYRDLRSDYAQMDRLRADIARDQYRLEQAWRYGDMWTARRIQNDIYRDQTRLDALRRDIQRDRRDIRHDQYERGYYYGYR